MWWRVTLSTASTLLLIDPWLLLHCFLYCVGWGVKLYSLAHSPWNSLLGCETAMKQSWNLITGFDIAISLLMWKQLVGSQFRCFRCSGIGSYDDPRPQMMRCKYKTVIFVTRDSHNITTSDSTTLACNLLSMMTWSERICVWGFAWCVISYAIIHTIVPWFCSVFSSAVPCLPLKIRYILAWIVIRSALSTNPLLLVISYYYTVSQKNKHPTHGDNVAKYWSIFRMSIKNYEISFGIKYSVCDLIYDVHFCV